MAHLTHLKMISLTGFILLMNDVKVSANGSGLCERSSKITSSIINIVSERLFQFEMREEGGRPPPVASWAQLVQLHADVVASCAE